MAGESGVLVLTEFSGSQLAGVSMEMIAVGKRLAGELGAKVTAVAFGSTAAEAAKQAIAFGADAAVVVDNAALDEYRNDTWTAALTAVAKEVNPAVVLIGQTAAGRDLAPRFAIRAGSASAMDCVGAGDRRRQAGDDAARLRRQRPGQVHQQDDACGRDRARQVFRAPGARHVARRRGHDDERRRRHRRHAHRLARGGEGRGHAPGGREGRRLRRPRPRQQGRLRGPDEAGAACWAAPSAPAAPSSTWAGCR